MLAFGLEWAVLVDAPAAREVGGGALILLGVLVLTLVRARKEAKLRSRE